MTDTKHKTSGSNEEEQYGNYSTEISSIILQTKIITQVEGF